MKMYFKLEKLKLTSGLQAKNHRNKVTKSYIILVIFNNDLYTVDSSFHWKCDVVLSMQIYILLKSNIVFKPAWLCMYYIQCVLHNANKIATHPGTLPHDPFRIFTTQSLFIAHSERPTVLLRRSVRSFEWNEKIQQKQSFLSLTSLLWLETTLAWSPLWWR